MGKIHFVVGERVSAGGIDAARFVGTRDGATLRFVITGEALEALAESNSHAMSLLDMFDQWTENVWAVAEAKASRPLDEGDSYLITEDDVHDWQRARG